MPLVTFESRQVLHLLLFHHNFILLFSGQRLRAASSAILNQGAEVSALGKTVGAVRISISVRPLRLHKHMLSLLSLHGPRRYSLEITNVLLEDEIDDMWVRTSVQENTQAPNPRISLC